MECQSSDFMNILAQGKDTKGVNLKTILKETIVQMGSHKQGIRMIEAPPQSHLGLPGSCCRACKSFKMSPTSPPGMFWMFSPGSPLPPHHSCLGSPLQHHPLWRGFSCGWAYLTGSAVGPSQHFLLFVMTPFASGIKFTASPGMQPSRSWAVSYTPL